MDIIKSACRSNFTIFLKFFLQFIKMSTKIQWYEYCDFVQNLINSKKIRKNVKFDLQAHFNISIMSNSWIDYLNFKNFENRECNSVSPKKM